MEIKNLLTFLQVASVNSFTKAGKILGYTQSNISMQIQQLEQDVGVKLFDRINRGVVLNQYGERLLPYAQQIVATANQMEQVLCSDLEMRGFLRVGLVESVNGVCFEQLYLQYHQRFPNAQMEITVDATTSLLEMLQKNLIDVALLIDEPLPKTNWQICCEKQVQTVAVMGKDHPLAQKETLCSADLKDQAFILMERNAPYNLDFERAMSQNNGHRIEPHLRLQDPATALGIVAQSRFVSILPSYAVREAEKAGSIQMRQITDLQQRQWVQAVLHKEKFITPLIRGFLDVVKNTLENI